MGRGLTVVNDRVGGDEYPRTSSLGSPAEIEIITEELEFGVESAEKVPDLASDEHAGRADREYVAHSVVLSLIVLASLKTGEAPSGVRDADTRFEQEAPIMPAEDLRPEDRGARIRIGCLEECVEAGGIRCAVIVKQPDPLRELPGGRVARERLDPAYVLKTPARGLSEPLPRRRSNDPVNAEGCSQQREAVI